MLSKVPAADHAALHPKWVAQAFGCRLEIACCKLLPDSTAGYSLTVALYCRDSLHGKTHFRTKLLQHGDIAFAASSEAEIFANHNAFCTQVCK